jgi:DUF4097 and DUF4098 domain-containing protein YvlB
MSCLFGIGLTACGALACDVQVHEGHLNVGVFSAEAKQDWTRTYSLSARGQIEIANLNGPIDVRQAPADKVEVHAEIIAKALTDEGARDILAKGKIEETISRERVKVETVVPRGIHGSYEVRYQVRVPFGVETQVSTTNGSVTASGMGGKLKASVVNGSVDLTDMSGALDAAAVNGSLSVKLAGVSGPIRLETTNGRLSLVLRKTSSATLSARVVNGGLTVSGFPAVEQRGNRIRNLETVLNGGGAPIDLRTTNGRLSIEGK